MKKKRKQKQTCQYRMLYSVNGSFKTKGEIKIPRKKKSWCNLLAVDLHYKKK